MTTLVLSPRQTDDAQRLWRAAISLGWSVVRAVGWRPPALPSDDIAIFGEPLFAQRIAESFGLVLTEPAEDWLARLPRCWSGREVAWTSLGRAREFDAPRFVKPVSHKEFRAGVYAHGGQLPAEHVLADSVPVLVQEVVSWTREYRCFIGDRKIAAISVYAREGQLAQAPDGSWPTAEAELSEAAAFCERVLLDHSVPLPGAVVIDVGEIRGRGWAVVESTRSGRRDCMGAILKRFCLCSESGRRSQACAQRFETSSPMESAGQSAIASRAS